jgi:hypothetical protein
LAGCSALQADDTDAEELTFERLDVTAVYVADDVGFDMPADVETVENTHNADLLVLPGDTGTDARQAVEWLADERVLALLGESAEETWLSWARSDAFDDAFSNGGYSDAEPNPQLLVGARIGQYVTTYRHTWSGGPRDRDVLTALDESLITIEQETPPG